MKVTSADMQRLFNSFSPYIEDALSFPGEEKWVVSGWEKQNGDLWRGYAMLGNKRYELVVSEKYIGGSLVATPTMDTLAKDIERQIDLIRSGKAHCVIIGA